MTDEKWENAMRDYLERHNPNATPEEIKIKLTALLNGTGESSNDHTTQGENVIIGGQSAYKVGGFITWD
jgi:hypothetical protein